MIVYSLIRNGESRGEIVTLDSGKCVVAWPNSVIVYDSEEAARAVHIDHMGGRGEKTKFDFRWASHPEITRGFNDCIHDDLENAPFSSVGGLDKRTELKAPQYSRDSNQYLIGYAASARGLYGADWRTCTFGWNSALEIRL